MLTFILLTLALYFITTLLPPLFDYVLQGKFMEGLSARDVPPPATQIGSRSRRALSNMTENMVLFLPLALLTLVFENAGGIAATGAAIFFFARLAFVPLYLLGVPWLRSGAYMAGLLGLLLMVLALVGA